MEKTKKKHIGLWIILGVLILLAALMIINRYTVRQLWCNIFSPTPKIRKPSISISTYRKQRISRLCSC